MIHIKVYVEGGVVQEIESDQPSKICVLLIDKDNIAQGDDPEGHEYYVTHMEEEE